MPSLDIPWTSDAPMGSPGFWLARAEEARILRNAMHDKICREMMLDVIGCYEGLAKSAAVVNASVSALRASSSRSHGQRG